MIFLCHVTKEFVMILFPQIVPCLSGSSLSDTTAQCCVNASQHLNCWKIQDLDLRFQLSKDDFRAQLRAAAFGQSRFHLIFFEL